MTDRVMGKYYRRRSYRKRNKYSVEQTVGTIITEAATGNGGIVVVPSTTLQGMRKVKHLTVSLATQATAGGSILYWALVYVPQGTGVGTISATGDMYEPNQYVMNCGVCDFDAGPVRISSPISRNLNSGDQIALIVRNPIPASYNYYASVRYAITLH